MDAEELLDHLRIMAKPVDYAILEKKGIIEKSGAWYIIHKLDELPDHVIKKSNTVSNANGQVRMKFDSHVKYEAMVKKAGG